jgi:hypothetical protein
MCERELTNGAESRYKAHAHNLWERRPSGYQSLQGQRGNQKHDFRTEHDRSEREQSQCDMNTALRGSSRVGRAVEQVRVSDVHLAG